MGKSYGIIMWGDSAGFIGRMVRGKLVNDAGTSQAMVKNHTIMLGRMDKKP
jgi:hypothetical protein